ncbi:MAG: hypothetical protein J2P15_23115 [Micromonosporaceae bacterium]|nr:hypothetical protein [Micromonosporaceae bacterium]
MTNEVYVELDSLQAAAEGITDLLGEMATKKVSDIDPAKSAFGHDDLAGTVENFCTRWNIGVQNLAKDAVGVSDYLVRCVYVYSHTDRTSGAGIDGVLMLPNGPDPAAGQAV